MYSLKWNLSQFYKSLDDEQIDKDIELVMKEGKRLHDKYISSDFESNIKSLKELLIDLESFDNKYSYGGKPSYYIYLNQFLDQESVKVKARYSQIEKLNVGLSSLLHFIYVRLSNIPEDKQKEILSDPSLKEYKNYLRNVFKFSKHILSNEKEEVVNELSDMASGAWNRLLESLHSAEVVKVKDSKGKIHTLNFEKLTDRFNSPDKVLRDNAAKSFNEILVKHSKVAEAEFNNTLQYKAKMDKIKKYSYPEESRYLSDDVEKEFVEDMCEYVKKYNDVSKDYYTLKAKVLGLKKLKYHERGLSFEKGESKFDLKKSIDIVKNVFNSIDPKFEGILHKFLSGNIDSESKKGKSGGAYCINVAKSLPTFILLNHHDKLQDLLTIAHEAGHGINSEMMKESQNALYFSTPPATAEIASTFFEDMVVDNLIENSKGVKKLNILLKKIDMDVSSIFRQVAFFNFEREVHTLFKLKHYLSNKEIGEVFTKHISSYMGSSVSQDKGSENWWMYVPHFRMYFYVYSYSMGLMIAKYMKAKYKKDKKYLINIKDFLSTGTSIPTSEVIKKLTGDKDHIWKMAIDEIKSNINDANKLFKEINGSQL